MCFAMNHEKGSAVASSQDGAAGQTLRLWQSFALLGMLCSWPGEACRAQGTATRCWMGSRVDIRLLLLFPSHPQTRVVLQGLDEGVMLAGEEAPTPSSADATSASSPSRLPAVPACDIYRLGPGEPLSTPAFTAVAGEGPKMMLGCPAMGWESRIAGAKEGDVVSQAVEGAQLWVWDGSLLAGHKMQDLLPHPAKLDSFCCTSPRCLGPVFARLHPKLPAVLHSHLPLRTLIP